MRSATRALAQLPDADLGYGDPAGHPRLRHELSAYLGRVRALIAPPERVVVVGGFAQASRLMAEMLKDRGILRIGVEDPGSVGLRDQLTQAGLTCLPVPVDGDGVRVDVLARSTLQAIVVTPAHQFPTGVVLSPDRRHAFLRWARDTGGLVIEDDYDAEFRYDRTPVGALGGLGPDVVIHGGSVSKTLAPALRIGWLLLPERLVTAVTDAKYATDLATGTLEQATLAGFIACGEMDHHIRRMATRYCARRDALVTAVTTHLPEWTVTGTAAGLHLVVRPPPGFDEVALAALAQRCGLDARPLGRYAIREPDRTGLVVGYRHRRPDALANGVARLARQPPGRLCPERGSRTGNRRDEAVPIAAVQRPDELEGTLLDIAGRARQEQHRGSALRVQHTGHLRRRQDGLDRFDRSVRLDRPAGRQQPVQRDVVGEPFAQPLEPRGLEVGRLERHRHIIGQPQPFDPEHLGTRRDRQLVGDGLLSGLRTSLQEPRPRGALACLPLLGVGAQSQRNRFLRRSHERPAALHAHDAALHREFEQCLAHRVA
jgi:GntR family transcriptional regulator/MocR family aminotransferase